MPLWEGHTRQFLETLVDAVLDAEGDAAAVASAVVAFMEKVATGFTRSSFGNLLVEEVREGCTRKRKGKPAVVQTLARLVMDEPDHRGVSKVLQRGGASKSDSAFASIKLDCQREFWDAARVGNYATVEAALAELTHRRTYARPKPPRRAISTIHKAKGLQCDAVAVIPCDANTFPDKDESRCLLYVAISRPKKRLLLVVSRDNPSPLLEI
ncbi:MAG: 3'-5' exonuclease [Polyangiaceae bacterium]